MNEQTITVKELNSRVKELLEDTFEFKNLRVIGEISNLKKHQTGHWYFRLKDEQSQINAVMFASYARRVRVPVNEGDKVVVTADIGVYLKTGEYQLYVRSIEPVGLGTLYLEFEKLKKQLQEEGLFAAEHKVKVPAYCNNIGVITAPKGAAVRDIITTIKRRWPIAQVTLIPALVQGVGAKEALVAALKLADEMNFDVILFGRGGGSIEDLWPFNEEIVARQIYAMKTPIVSGVGHEIDFTISDFVADVRAATPTAAAELVTPNRLDVIQRLKTTENRLISLFSKEIEQRKQALDRYKQSRVLTRSEDMLAAKRMTFDIISGRFSKAQTLMFTNLKYRLADYKSDLKRLITAETSENRRKYEILKGKINALSPLSVLNRGYGIATIDGKVVDSVRKAEINAKMKLRVKDGAIISVVTEKEE